MVTVAKKPGMSMSVKLAISIKSSLTINTKQYPSGAMGNFSLFNSHRKRLFYEKFHYHKIIHNYLKEILQMLKTKQTFYTCFALFIITLITLSVVIYGQTQSQTLVRKRIIAVERQPTDSHELTAREVEEFDTSNTPRIIKARRIAAFKPGRDLLIANGFPLEPYVLLENNWRNRLRNVIRHMPQFQETRRTENTMSGVQLADTLILPDGIELTGDTVIIANRISFEGNVFIKKNDFNLYIFLISEQ